MKIGQLLRLTMGPTTWQSFFESLLQGIKNHIPMVLEKDLDENGYPNTVLDHTFYPAVPGEIVIYLGTWTEKKTESGKEDSLARVLYQEHIYGVPIACLEEIEELDEK